jgi:anaerobic ribonucleoside-triphosphate reductase activating protein
LTGGEPFLQAEQLIPFLQQIQLAGLSIVCFTGFELDEIRKSPCPDFLRYIDILIAGPFIKELEQLSPSLLGSSNKSIHFLTSRYNEADFEDIANKEVEIQIENGNITITGFPSEDFIKEIEDALNLNDQRRDKELKQDFNQ